jgi:hypothetical protein
MFCDLCFIVFYLVHFVGLGIECMKMYGRNNKQHTKHIISNNLFEIYPIWYQL